MIKVLGAIPEVRTIRVVLHVLGSHPFNLQFQANTDLLAFMRDARRFVLESRYIIETAPLQVYESALLFSPEASTRTIKRQFLEELPGWIERPPMVGKDWTPSLQALEGHSNSIRAVVFSPDGQLLTSAFTDKTLLCVEVSCSLVVEIASALDRVWSLQASRNRHPWRRHVLSLLRFYC